LIDAGADVNAICRYQSGGERCIEEAETTALLSALGGGLENIALDLLAAGADANALAAAAANGRAAIVRRLLLVESGDEARAHALVEACRTNRIEIATILLENGVDVNVRWNENSALQTAAWLDHEGLVIWLLEHGADIAQSGGEALCAAANAGRTEIVRLLIARGAPIDHRNAFAWTPLMSAAWQGQTETLRVLLANGANLMLQDDRGKRAIDWAREAGHLQIVELLETIPT
jgi:hypothetical protein